MATPEASSQPAAISVGSYDTALCIIPPEHLWPAVDGLRCLYDKAYEQWPPHVNLIYPFVPLGDLPRASESITSQLKSRNRGSEEATFEIRLEAADVFPHRHDNTIFICDNDSERTTKIKELRNVILLAFGQRPDDYRMHMTVGQTEELNSAHHQFLLEKARLLPNVQWTVDKLHILVRERKYIDWNVSSQMRLWGTIDLTTFTCSRRETPTKFYESNNTSTLSDAATDAVIPKGLLDHLPYTFTPAMGKWVQHEDNSERESSSESKLRSSIAIASYNVLAEFHHPPSHARYPIVIRNLLHKTALADVLVLEEVTDDFLSYLCKNDEVTKNYPFITHGPPDQADLEPLPSHLNVVVLSRSAFTWTWLSFRRSHKGSVILQFRDIGKRDGNHFIPAILSTVHLTRGLTDGAVATKKVELQSIVNYLSTTYPRNPWILAGDFNITTSAYTIEAALKKKAISSQTATYLKALDTTLTEAGLVDTWAVSRVQCGDSSEFDHDQRHLNGAFEGEQGATLDPTVNELAAENVGTGFNNRPQRYDRILVKGRDLFTITSFNIFGQTPGTLSRGSTGGDSSDELTQAPELSYGSDHWGVRCSLRIRDESKQAPEDVNSPSVPVHFEVAAGSLADASELKHCLAERNIFPTKADITKREDAFALLKHVVLEDEAIQARGKPAFVIVPVGSYGLGVWSATSDIDCLCIGPVSSKTFFTLATQRLRRAASRGVKLLRRVNANSGTMLELEVLDIKMDLQYCPSTFIAETWPYAMQLPPTDPVFSLSTQTLAKLKPVRDLYYLRRTIPDYAAFRTAYQLIKCWAKQRGVYAAKYGYLGGIHLSILLSRVCKLLSLDGRPVSVPTIVVALFRHYANFDWKNQMVFDPFFHKHLRYVRTAREPLAILGFHAPKLNVAHTASLPSVRTLSEELRRADALLSQDGMTWARFLGEDTGPADFLAAYKSYVKIDAQFWGVSLAKGSGFVGWLESRCVMLLVDLNRRLPNIHARIWPARFVAEDAEEEDTDYQGYYLIGLDKWEGSNSQPMTKDDMKVAADSLQTVLQKFETQIRGDEKYFDAKSCWMSASIARQPELGALRLDTREWGEYSIGDDESEDEEEEEEQPLTDGDSGAKTSTNAKKSKSRRQAAAATDGLPTRPGYEGKFRSSADVINRIRWDPAMDSGDYIVGYEDRFLGVRERAIDDWKAEQTDEEFIPQHRILYFKHRSDGAVVWDRKGRRDAVFGSGFGGGDVAAAGLGGRQALS
ncbi:Uu.00g049380.m01.CDS01 [Anthostomella pinea]|uniref:polynucleotide adenylyltransferase n=1 Tax=Anthostomella pinea TaxID=933095 RepID=A0AAI8VBW1_9PEZI|nr:Uu.00g049380.m01.CDS01 [Anthostomella pinea]